MQSSDEERSERDEDATACVHVDDATRLPCVMACVGVAHWATALGVAMLSARRTGYARSAVQLERALQRETCLQRRSGLAVSLTAIQSVLQQGVRFLLFRAANEHLRGDAARTDSSLWRYTVADLAGTRARWQAKLDAADLAIDASPRAHWLRLAVRRHLRLCSGSIAFHDAPTVHEFFVQCELLLGLDAPPAARQREPPMAFVRHALVVPDADDSDDADADEPRETARSVSPPVDHTLDSLESAADAFSSSDNDYDDDDDDEEEEEFEPAKRRRRK